MTPQLLIPAIPSIDPHALRAILAHHLPMYRRKEPRYQALMLGSLLELWQGRHRRLIDIGGGTGVIAEAIAKLLPVDQVETVDLVDRFCPGLSVGSRAYDGKTLPFCTGDFAAATLNNVLHHVPKCERIALLREIRRVVSGPLYIKDHATTGALDDLRLTALDAIGNIPFDGMIAAQYLSRSEWRQLAAAGGWRIAAEAQPVRYRSGVMALAFPNRLEITLRLEPA